MTSASTCFSCSSSRAAFIDQFAHPVERFALPLGTVPRERGSVFSNPGVGALGQLGVGGYLQRPHLGLRPGGLSRPPTWLLVSSAIS
ncbi:hypothetical protein OG806_49430 [Streptomyces sp. NBC_00882]|uniref:hypothetical protein n=1 Tax=Streptomyces TaxID=1883 RepID=UPI00386E4B91|nr:hypothetical protein OG806_00520 [Streptomyces sp. NBC_00882]WSZ36841.1 hypothetical protein OG806_49430 [Streptomyces sp. NBC_00882]WSZ55082.1 hypothetical protein OH824_00115 [Streptomyces canus]WSZ63828.1 hypothetical protein OH824_48705 [Streptomyces canus]